MKTWEDITNCDTFYCMYIDECVDRDLAERAEFFDKPAKDAMRRNSGGRKVIATLRLEIVRDDGLHVTMEWKVAK